MKMNKINKNGDINICYCSLLLLLNDSSRYKHSDVHSSKSTPVGACRVELKHTTPSVVGTWEQGPEIYVAP